MVDESGSHCITFSQNISAVIKLQMAMAHRKDVFCIFEEARTAYGLSFTYLNVLPHPLGAGIDAFKALNIRSAVHKDFARRIILL